ncbi:Sua5 family C-terminal domain-containing protein, partial [Sphingomonas segetis]|uniref:Sua5 family C-terminal domain-containing protein n=1 Tax=Sphingomonas segetis TaxID=1104779 RepID=UPI0023B3316F
AMPLASLTEIKNRLGDEVGISSWIPVPQERIDAFANATEDSHYAPSKPLRLEVTAADETEYLIGFGPIAGDATLSRSGDLVEAAATLFDLLHVADASEMPRIAVAPVPDERLGSAINDRLRRAAARGA